MDELIANCELLFLKCPPFEQPMILFVALFQSRVLHLEKT